MSSPNGHPSRFALAADAAFARTLGRLLERSPRTTETLRRYFLACDRLAANPVFGPKKTKRRRILAFACLLPFGIAIAALGAVVPDWGVFILFAAFMLVSITPLMTIIDGPFLDGADSADQ